MTISQTQPATIAAALTAEVWVYAGAVLLAVIAIAVMMKCYKRCPSNRILVVYGNVGGGRSCKCLHGGGAFVAPLVQDYSYLSLELMTAEPGRVRLRSKDGVELGIAAAFTFGISTRPDIMEIAAERLLNLPQGAVREQGEEIIYKQLALIVGALTADQIETDRERFMNVLVEHVGREMGTLGLELINVNIAFIEREPT
jgi:flotillin